MAQSGSLGWFIAGCLVHDFVLKAQQAADVASTLPQEVSSLQGEV